MIMKNYIMWKNCLKAECGNKPVYFPHGMLQDSEIK